MLSCKRKPLEALRPLRFFNVMVNDMDIIPQSSSSVVILQYMYLVGPFYDFAFSCISNKMSSLPVEKK